MSFLSTVKDWIELVTEYDSENVVLDYGGGPEPTGDYAAFGQPIADEELVVPFESNKVVDAGGITITHYVQTRVTVPISIYAFDGGSKLRDLALSVRGFAPRKLLTDGNIVFVQKGPIQNLTEFNDTGADPRFNADFEFLYGDEWTESDFEVWLATFNGRLKPDSGDDLIDSYELDFT